MAGPTRLCGECKHHDDGRTICLLNMSYAAFVYKYSEAGDCPAYERPKDEPAAKPAGPVPNFWRNPWGLP